MLQLGLPQLTVAFCDDRDGTCVINLATFKPMLQENVKVFPADALVCLTVVWHQHSKLDLSSDLLNFVKKRRHLSLG